MPNTYWDPSLHYLESLNYASESIRAHGWPDEIADAFLEEHDVSSLSELTPEFCLQRFKEGIHDAYVKVPEGLMKDIVDVYIEQADWKEIRDMTRRRLFDYHHPMDDPDYDEDLYLPFANGNQIRMALQERIRVIDYHESIVAHFLKEFTVESVERMTEEYVRSLYLSQLEALKQILKHNVLTDFVTNAQHEIDFGDVRMRAEAVLQNLSKENDSSQ